jgi:hypothetical protein
MLPFHSIFIKNYHQSYKYFNAISGYIMKISKTISRLILVLESKVIGDDLLITLTGGKEHIGAAALAYTDSGRTTVSVMTAPGHKEEEIAMRGAKIISKALNKTVLFSAGIHLDQISINEIYEIENACVEIIQEYIQTYSNSEEN